MAGGRGGAGVFGDGEGWGESRLGGSGRAGYLTMYVGGKG